MKRKPQSNLAAESKTVVIETAQADQQRSRRSYGGGPWEIASIDLGLMPS